MTIAGRGAQRTTGDWRAKLRLALPVGGVAASAALGIAVVSYLLWPQWPEAPVATDAPSIPISISGVLFNIPPASIRVAVQRRAGAQERVDLSFLWPSLEPPPPAPKDAKGPPALPGERLFVTIAANAGLLAPAERLRTIYPRYFDGEAEIGPDGLMLMSFGADTPYKGEDLLYDPDAPERFAMRCTRTNGRATPGICLHEHRLGEATDITFRFPRAWLADWPAVSAGFDRLIAQLKAEKQ